MKRRGRVEGRETHSHRFRNEDGKLHSKRQRHGGLSHYCCRTRTLILQPSQRPNEQPVLCWRGGRGDRGDMPSQCAA